MMIIRSLKIRTRVSIGFFITLALALLIGAVSSLNAIHINDRNRAVYKTALAPLESLMKVETAFANVRQTSRGFIIRITSDPTQLEKQEERLKGLLSAMTLAVDSYIQTLIDSGSSTQLIDNSKAVKTSFESDFRPMIEQMIIIAETGDISETVALLDSTNEVASVIYDGIQEIYNLTLSEMSNSVAQNEKDAENAVILSIVITAFTLIVSIILSTVLSRSISKPVDRLLDITKNLAHGNLSINKMEEAKDEIGTLTTNFYTVIDTLNVLVSDMDSMSKQHNNGDIDVKIDTSKFEGVYNDVATGINDMVFSYIGTVVEVMGVLNSIADGQFEVDIRQYPGKKAILNTVIDNIKTSLKAISAEIHMLTDAAAKGNLSRRGDEANYKGDWANMVSGINVLLDNMSAPIHEATDVLQQIAQGNLDEKITSNYQGDFALIKTAVNSMSTSVASYISELSDVLYKVSKNDFSPVISREYVGQFSAIKMSINLIVDKLNEIMREIRSASEQVLVGSKQISDSNMTLAQGATEQASAIEELTATIETLNEKTQNNAANARTANELSTLSKQNAAVCNEEMKHMLTSMEGIKESSNNISSIIKVIEDISFKTNLLALNAAVEAARAGEQGKGFSVVAKEVRDLASQSQEAAKQTNILINDSINKVDEGTKAASNTASSLGTIIEDFDRVSTIINDIAAASNEQATAISEVNIGVSQISQVVQANTATSEESASASQELASQSEMLSAMVGVFKLKD